MSERVLGIDIGGTTVHGIVIDPADGRIVAETRTPTVPGADGIRAGIARVAADLAPDDPTAGIGVGIPGLVNDGTVRHAVNLGVGAEPLDVLAVLRSLTTGPVAVENDVKAAALGAGPWLAEAEPGVTDYALLNVGTGLAVGLVLGGVLWRGSTGLAGEIGHLTFERTGPICKCGKRGCLELYTSGSGLRDSWGGTTAELFDSAAEGDEHAAAVADSVVDGLAHAITLVAHTVDVERVLVTGGVVSETPALTDAVLARLGDQSLAPVGAAAAIADRVRWLPAGVPVGALGAALLTTGRWPAWRS